MQCVTCVYSTTVLLSCIVVALFSLKWNWTSNIKLPSLIEEHLLDYDYIIVGGGTCGCVLASILSNNPNNSVLLIEAGGEFGILSSIPLAATFMQKSPLDWSFNTEPQKYSSFGLFNQSQALPRGKGLGGSGQLNYMLHSTGLPENFDNWEKLGALNWGYKDLEKYLNNVTNKNSETAENLISKMFIEELYDSQLANAFVESMSELKLPDLNFNPTVSTVRNGERWSSYQGYLRPVHGRKNLHILLNSIVKKIGFLSNIASYVVVARENKNESKIVANKEIILSLGAIHTPQLLMLSGIGPKEHLNELDIPVIKDLKGVGQNLFDHLNMPLYVTIDKPVSVTMDKMLHISAIWNYFVYRKGLWANSAIVGLGTAPENIGLILFGMGSVDEEALCEIANLQPETFRSAFPFYLSGSQEGFIFLTTCTQPESRGNISLDSNHYQQKPLVNPNYLSVHKDVECMIKGLHLVQEIINTQSFKSLGATIHWPKFTLCSYLEVDPNNDDYLECIIRVVGLTAHHPGGTCAIGQTQDAVVDHLLRVRGVSRLRIMDASVMPAPIAGTPNSVLIAMAERAAKIILESENNSDDNGKL